MRSRRLQRAWPAGLLGGGVLAASVLAQSPPCPPEPRPVAPTGPGAASSHHHEGGPIKRALRRSGRVLQDNFAGYPQEFVEPPPGYYVAEAFGTMKSKANVHRFMLYRSDFLDGTDRLSPGGATRFGLMAARLDGWLGPIVVEWSPDQPALAESRRAAVLAILQSTGVPVVAERVVIGPAPFPGLLGSDAVQNYNVLMNRDLAAPSTYSLSPSAGAGFGSGSGSATGGAP